MVRVRPRERGHSGLGHAVGMSTPIPPPLRAAAGLAALAIDSARKVPQQLVGLPVLAVSTALQASLKAQQAYAELIARGDEVLGQLRSPQENPPWARFDDEPAGARAPSAFDVAVDAADEAAHEPEAADGVADALAAEDLADALTAEAAEEAADLVENADLVAAELAAEQAELAAEKAGLTAEDAELADEIDRELDPDQDADVVPLADAVGRAEARAAQAEADAFDVLGDTEEDELAGADAARRNGDRPDGSGTEPGVDLPAEGMALAADAAAAGAAIGADGYLAAAPPVAGYDELSIPQLRGRLRSLTSEQIEALLAYERSNRARPPYLTMLENRLRTLRSR
jgi:hypothetical protein